MERTNIWILHTLVLIAVPAVAQFDFNPYKLFGCFDKASHALSSTNSEPVSGSLTLEKCRDSCARKSATYFGVSEGVKCECFPRVILKSANSVPPLTVSCYGENAKRCGGDDRQYCGADDAYLIYSVCPPGNHGINCQESCNCNLNLCTFEGTCSRWLCYPGYEYKVGSGCNACRLNKYGFKCYQDCLHCSGSCDSKTGECGSCSSGKGPYCLDTCPIGKWGPNCENTCSGRCLDGKCNHDNGHCTACKESSSWGDSCEQYCRTGCSPRECDLETGVCNYWCSDGYYGGYCNITCPLNCLQKCDKPSGDCTNGCDLMTWGARCTSECPDNCAGGCNQTDGACVDACKGGWYGDFCNMSCPTNCLDSTCDRDSGECDGCRDGWRGVICNEVCLNNCLKCEQYGEGCNGNCETGYCGDNCDEICPTTTTESQVSTTHTGADETKSDFLTGIVAGACIVVGIVVSLIIVIVFICWRNGKCKQQPPAENPVDLTISGTAPTSSPNVVVNEYEHLDMPTQASTPNVGMTEYEHLDMPTQASTSNVGMTEYEHLDMPTPASTSNVGMTEYEHLDMPTPASTSNVGMNEYEHLDTPTPASTSNVGMNEYEHLDMPTQASTSPTYQQLATKN